MDKLLFGLSVAAIGMLVVFAGLIILIGSIKVIGWVSKLGDRKKSQPKAAPAPAPVIAAAPAPVVEAGVTPEIVAAITAAIAAVWQAPTGFTVRHIKRVSNASAWNRAGREDQMYSRM